MNKIVSQFAAVFAISLVFVSPASALNANQSAAISENCANIKQVLRLVQRDDSKSRISVGAIYETISSHYITPLNIRLIAGNHGNPELVALQTNFAATRSEFSSKFIEYSKSFEQLLASDCNADPEHFYQLLETTRSLRAEVQTLTEKLNQTAGNVTTLTKKSREEIK